MNKDSKHIIMGIDPGPEQSAWVMYRPSEAKVLGGGLLGNTELREGLVVGITDELRHVPTCCVIESVECYGMVVGKSTFDTCVEIGRFIQTIWVCGRPVYLMPRKTVKLHLCNSMRAKDKNIRQALIDRIGPIGIKKNPGPCYGMKSHLWSALAIALTFAETHILHTPEQTGNLACERVR